MGVFRLLRLRVPAVVGWALLSVAAVPALHADATAERRLINGWEIHDELTVKPGSEAAVKDYFPSFLEYQDLVMFHPKFGYYASGRVNFSSDYQTFPIVLYPYFGQMIAEQMYHMWEGMRRAGTLTARDRFTIAEFGAGNGMLAESILDYFDQQTDAGGSEGWRDFAAQVRYICYDRSHALSEAQRKRNARFGARFEAREADATDPTAAIQPGSLKGVVLSNELPDAFSVHKVILSGDGTAEVAYVAGSLSRSNWEQVRREVPAGVAEAVIKGDNTVREKFLSRSPDRVYLTRKALVALLEAVAPSKEYEPIVQSLNFHEIYIPVRYIPELAAHLRRYARLYAVELARSGRGVVTYVNLGSEGFIQGAGRILKSGYVITLDYGTNWQGMMAQDAHPHLRTYGPAHQSEIQSLEPDADDQQPGERDTSNPYAGPTLNDMTTDVNFSLLEAEGKLVGLTTAYFGAQAALRTGTPISLGAPPSDREGGWLADEFFNWAASFETDGNYKLMVQQKQGTDPSYSYPGQNAEPLASDEKSLTDTQRAKLAEIEKRLGSGTQATAAAR
jgi:SAM-dependent MidA family methyltransferase